MMQRTIKHFPELKDKNKNIKSKARDLLAKLKLLCFINNENIDEFYLKIKKYFKNSFAKFFIYYENTYLYHGIFANRN